MEKSKEYHDFLEQLAKEVAKDKPILSDGIVVDCNELPCGSAIIWKMQNIESNDWEKIPLKEIAIAIKEGLNMADFAEDYNVKLKKKS